MTLALVVKVHDGIVLAADSASTLVEPAHDGQPEHVVKVWKNATKVFNLRKGLPLGAVTWGEGAIGSSSIAMLSKDLRRRFSDHDDNLYIDPHSYSVEQIAGQVADFFLAEYDRVERKGDLGFIVTGFSCDAAKRVGLAQEFIIEMKDGKCEGARPLRDEQAFGVHAEGAREAVERLRVGFSPALEQALKKTFEGDANMTKNIDDLLGRLRDDLEIPLVASPSMPLRDAIDLAAFLGEMTIGYMRFVPGEETVAPPLEIAAITRYEGFKWVRRSYFYDHALNPDPDELWKPAAAPPD